ncbi:MAG: hypothetical protein M3N22_06085, partial [Acidobacteriota bacterium]|nr:hypothetical protein [Acidobacteriota bacterium]
MKRNTSFVFSLAMAATVLAACSGSHRGSGGGGGGGGSQKAQLTITMTSSAPVSLTSVSVLSANVGITGITLNPLTGNPVPVTLTPAILPVDLMRLQTDTAFLASITVPAQTYNSATITLGALSLTLDNQSGSIINGTCATASVCQVTLPAGSAQVTVAPFPLTLIAAQKTGVSLNLDLNSALTFGGGTLALNFSAANVFTVTTLPRTGTLSGAVDEVRDFVGTVTAITSSSVTVQSASGISLQFILPASPAIEDPQGLCSALNLTCLVANKTVVSVDGTVNTDGTLSLLSADLLDATPRDELEGTVLSNGTAGQFFLVLANKVVASGNTTLAAANAGDSFLVTLNNPTFIVDSDELFNNASYPTSTVSAMFSSEANLIDGQDVVVHVTVASGSAAGKNQAVTTDQVRLRFTRTTGTIVSVSGQSFTLSSV